MSQKELLRTSDKQQGNCPAKVPAVRLNKLLEQILVIFDLVFHSFFDSIALGLALTLAIDGVGIATQDPLPCGFDTQPELLSLPPTMMNVSIVWKLVPASRLGVQTASR